jgi:hypothetical protein
LPQAPCINLAQIALKGITLAKFIRALKTILIDALEPHQNRKRGDDLAAVEHLQKTYPKIEKRKLRLY